MYHLTYVVLEGPDGKEIFVKFNVSSPFSVYTRTIPTLISVRVRSPIILKPLSYGIWNNLFRWSRNYVLWLLFIVIYLHGRTVRFLAVPKAQYFRVVSARYVTNTNSF